MTLQPTQPGLYYFLNYYGHLNIVFVYSLDHCEILNGKKLTLGLLVYLRGKTPSVTFVLSAVVYLLINVSEFLKGPRKLAS